MTTVTTVTMMKRSPDPKTKASESLLRTLPEQHRGGGFLADVFRGGENKTRVCRRAHPCVHRLLLVCALPGALPGPAPLL